MNTLITVLIAFCCSAIGMAAQIQAVLVPPGNVTAEIEGMVLPIMALESLIDPAQPPMMLPFEAAVQMPVEARMGMRIVFLSDAVQRPTPIWEVQLHGLPVASDSSDDAFVPVERQPEFDANLLAKNVVYPAVAKEQEREGSVMVGALIGPDGMVERVSIIRSDNEIFNGAAATAVALTPFTPAVSNGVANRMWVRIPVQFKLQ